MNSYTCVTSELLRDWPLPRLDADGDKESRGSVVVVGGSVHMPGSILLTAEACLRSGAGKVQVFTAPEVAQAIAMQMPEAWVGCFGPGCVQHALIQRCNALVIGPGLDNRKEGAAVLDWLGSAAPRVPLVLDAYALTAVRTIPARHTGRLVLTPHAGEMAMLLDWTKEQVLGQPLAAARQLAVDLPAVVLLKGARTWIVTPEGDAWLSSAGGIGLATAGSGDVLAGILAGFIAQGAPPEQAAVWAAHLHGLCGEHQARIHGTVGFLARDLLAVIPRIRAQLSG